MMTSSAPTLPIHPGYFVIDRTFCLRGFKKHNRNLGLTSLHALEFPTLVYSHGMIEFVRIVSIEKISFVCDDVCLDRCLVVEGCHVCGKGG